MLKLNIQLFAEPEVEVNEQEKMYLETISELKHKLDNDMISKTEYEALLAENKKLLDKIVNQRPAPVVETPKTVPAAELAKQLSNIKSGDISNKDYIKLVSDYRDAFIKETGQDPFSNSIVTNKGVEFERAGENQDANEIAQAFKSILEDDLSPSGFNIKLDSILQDDQAVIRAARQRK